MVGHLSARMVRHYTHVSTGVLHGDVALLDAEPILCLANTSANAGAVNQVMLCHASYDASFPTQVPWMTSVSASCLPVTSLLRSCHGRGREFEPRRPRHIPQ
jgi:hypothetical protein